MIQNIFQVLIIGVMFAILNRIRGGGLNYLIKYISGISKPAIGLIISALAYHSHPDRWVWWVTLVYIALYWGGESFGWGKWVGTVLDGEPRYSEDEGKIEIFGVTIWDGIHHIANAIVPERVNCVLYSKIALVVRGLYWWAPLFIFSYIIGTVTGMAHVLWVIVIAVGFPGSLLIAKEIKLKIPPIMKSVIDGKVVSYGDHSQTDKNWIEAEVVYGFIQGVVLAAVFL